MNNRQIIILLITTFVVIIYLNIPANKKWLENRILSFAEEIATQTEHMKLEERKEIRWQSSYTAIVTITDFIKKQDKSDPLVLLPPQSYYKKIDARILIPEPVVCYYFTGLKTTTIKCKDVYKATGCLIHNGKEFIYQPLKDSTEVSKVIEIYKNT
ncbi:MAG: hypothetical protein H6550_07650 [Chitinophagales bacterium]|nr:hypothetical protein [Chitinophagales bacterium]